ncbi:MAG TPA: DnaA/Hda family protein [Dongiaceae bacterium]
MPAEQLSFPLPIRIAMGAADFVVSESNRDAVAWLDRWPEWPGSILAIYGPAGCGKTHLAHVWQMRSHAVFLPDDGFNRLPSDANVVLDGRRLAEEDLFHRINHVRSRGLSLLILDREPPARWPVSLPDLASRLAGLPSIAVQAPDDALLEAILHKHFSDRQIRVTPEVVAYLVRRIERSFAAAEQVATKLDRLALSRGSAISIKLAREIFDEDRSDTAL